MKWHDPIPVLWTLIVVALVGGGWLVVQAVQHAR